MAKKSKSAAPKKKEHHLSDLIGHYIDNVKASRISLEDLMELLGNRSIGGLLLILSLPLTVPLAAPALSGVFGIPLILIAIQLVMGRNTVWLPKFLKKRSFSRDKFVRTFKRIMPLLRGLEKLLKPRLAWLSSKWMAIPIGVVCILLAVTIALPVPFGNIIPSFALIFFALGLVQHDGLAIAFGYLVSLIASLLVWGAVAGAISAIDIF
ncbi:MAG: exopolysaccharide biosynthesis protein [Alphaproteobacteria bacterium]